MNGFNHLRYRFLKIIINLKRCIFKVKEHFTLVGKVKELSFSNVSDSKLLLLDDFGEDVARVLQDFFKDTDVLTIHSNFSKGIFAVLSKGSIILLLNSAITIKEDL